MSILSTCQAPPPEGWVSLGECEARFVAQPVDRSPLSRSRAYGMPRVSYPDIIVECEESKAQVTQESLFLPTQQYPWKRAWNTMWDHGLLSALEGLEEDTEGTDNEGQATRLALGLLQYIRKVQTLYYYIKGEKELGECFLSQPNVIQNCLFPFEKITGLEMAAQYSHIPNWTDSIIRAIALHPKLPYIAIGRQDDVIEVKSLDEADHRVLLRDKKQVGVICMQWAPHYDQLLAVGAATCILLWHLDPTAPCSRFLTTWVRVESSPGHAPISSLSWSPQGNFLVSSSPSDNNLIIWDVPMGVASKVHRSRGGGVTNVVWSPDGGRVFAGCRTPLFRVWESLRWSCEKWTNLIGRCKVQEEVEHSSIDQVACWSPKGDILLFALEGDPSLYYICFRGNELAAGSTSAIKCADLSPSVLRGDSGTEFLYVSDMSLSFRVDIHVLSKVGGCVQYMAWDSTGERLAIIFTSESPCADLVAVLRTRTSHLLDVLPGGFVRGHEGEVPSTVTFKTGHGEGALLTTAWSSGRISFTPLCFQSPYSMTTPTYSPEQLTPLTSLQPTLTRSALGAPFSAHHTTLYSAELDSD